jgi:hypothetical protein
MSSIDGTIERSCWINTNRMHVCFLAACGEATAAATSCLFHDEPDENTSWGWLMNSEKRAQILTADLRSVAASKPWWVCRPWSLIPEFAYVNTT